MKLLSKIKNHSSARFATVAAGGLLITVLGTSCNTTNYPVGDFSLAYRGDSRSLERLPSNISPGQLQAQLNQNPTRRTDGTVVVTKSPNGWLVTDAQRGSRSMLTVTQSNAGLMRVVRGQKGNSSKVDIQRIEFVNNQPPEPNFFGRRRPGNDDPGTNTPPDTGTPPPNDPSNGKYPPGSGHMDEDGRWVPNPDYRPPSTEKPGNNIPGGRDPSPPKGTGTRGPSLPGGSINRGSRMKLPSIPRTRIPTPSRTSKR